jgi:YVTN family beta-propeller protein
MARDDAAWVSGLALLLVAGTGWCEARGIPSASRAGRTAGAVTIYVANAAEGTVTPIQAARNTAGRPIRVGGAPTQIAISPDGQTAYVVGARSFQPDAVAPVTLTAIRTATNRPGRVVTVCARGNLGYDIATPIAITPDSGTVYVSCLETGQVVPVRAGADTASKPIRISSPGALAIAADGRTVYVANSDGNTITPISTATDEPGQPIVVGQSPAAMAVTPDGTTVLVLTSTGVTPVDAATNQAGQPVAIEEAYSSFAVAVAPDGDTAYVLVTPSSDSQQGFAVPVHFRAGTRGKPIKVGLNPQQIAFTPDGTMAYVANYASASVTPIRLADGKAGPAIAAGNIPTRLAVSPDGTTVHVLDSNIFGGMGPGMPVRMLVRMLFRRPPFGKGQVIPINVATNSAGKPIKVGRFPIAIAIAS